MPKKGTHAHHHSSTAMTHSTPGQHKMLSHVIVKKPGGTLGSGIKIVISPHHKVRHHK